VDILKEFEDLIEIIDKDKVPTGNWCYPEHKRNVASLITLYVGQYYVRRDSLNNLSKGVDKEK